MDRYSAILQALGCICRTLVALGQETCCETSGRRLWDGKQQVSRESSTRPPRLSLESSYSNDSDSKNHAAEKRLRLRKSSSESIKSVKKCSANAAAGSCCPKDKATQDLPIDAKCLKPCCSEKKPFKEPCSASTGATSCCSKAPTTNVNVEAGRSGLCCTDKKAVKAVKDAPADKECPGSCCSVEKPTKQHASQSGSSGSCCSGNLCVEEDAGTIGGSGSCCSGDSYNRGNTQESIPVDSCCSKIEPGVELPAATVELVVAHA
jgi:Cd2+-exporting ATPase